MPENSEFDKVKELVNEVLDGVTQTPKKKLTNCQTFTASSLSQRRKYAAEYGNSMLSPNFQPI